MHIPRYSELDETQERIRFLPLDGMHVITGPPGTGKSVLAVCRHELLKDDDRDPTLVTFSNLLSQYIHDPDVKDPLANITLSEVNTKTFHSWMWKFWRDNFKQRPPQIEPYVHDWDRIMAEMNKLGRVEGTALVIDEGQDLPKPFYSFLGYLKADLTIFVDDNQSISDNPTYLLDMCDHLEVEMDEVTRIKKNYRNHLQIWNLAKRFFTETTSGIPDAPSKDDGEVIYRHYDSKDETLERIKIDSENEETLDIAVFLPTVEEVYDYWKQLTYKLRNSEYDTRRKDNLPQFYMGKNGARRISEKNNGEGFVNGEVPLINFEKGHILVTTYESAKGLEFDRVYIPSLQILNPPAFAMDDDGTLKKFYVLTSRARTYLELSHHGPGDTPITRALKQEVEDANKQSAQLQPPQP